MNQINSKLENYLSNSIKLNRNRLTRLIKKYLIQLIKALLLEKKVNQILSDLAFLSPKQFIEEIFEILNFSFIVSDKDIQKVPTEGKVICVSNHPIGSLDSLALLKIFLDRRSDVKIVANDFLMSVSNLKDLLLPINLFNNTFQKNNIRTIIDSLNADHAIIIFPAGSVSRLNGLKIKDAKWNKGAVYFSQKTNSPILPVRIDAKNSLLFYLVSIISKKISMILLVRELFNKKNKTIRIHIGDIIPAKAFTESMIDAKYQAKLLKNHVYRLNKSKKLIFNTEKTVINAIDKKILKKELKNSKLLSITNDGYKIYITNKSQSPYLINEIGRLRELTFRKIGEGTGKRYDVDEFDNHYEHIIIWDEEELEIVGSYRLGLCNKIISEKGIGGLYTNTLFNFNKNFIEEILPYSLELGRSFIQQKYWNSNALFYLWKAIGSYLLTNNSIKYLFGAVSISNNYSSSAKESIVHFYNKWFKDENNFASAKNKFTISELQSSQLINQYNIDDYKTEYQFLKSNLMNEGFSIPILYKHYTELCEDKGASFIDFNVDPLFSNCIDGLILIDVSKIKAEKKKRYFNDSWQIQEKISA